MTKIFHSLLILAFIATGLVDSTSAHAAVKNSPTHSARHVKGACKNLPITQHSQCQQETNQAPNQKQPDCEILQCNFHFMFVGQSTVFNLANHNKNHAGFIENQPFFLQQKTSKRPPRFLS